MLLHAKFLVSSGKEFVYQNSLSSILENNDAEPGLEKRSK